MRVRHTHIIYKARVGTVELKFFWKICIVWIKMSEVERSGIFKSHIG